MIKFNQLLGYYMPAFFKLYIRTLDPIDLRKLTPAELCTFVHEYTHFIQDFTTIKGLQNIYNTFEQLSLFVNETYRTRKLRIPIQAYHPVLSLNQNISDRTWGSHINISNIVSLSKIASKKVDLSQDVLNQHPELNSLRAVTATANLADGTQQQIEIGTLAVMESMAHLAEGLMGFTPTDSPDYPYNTVRLMANAICGALQLSDEILFAVCDVALQTSVPGSAVHEMLLRYANGTCPVPQNGYDVYATHAHQFATWSDQSAKSIVTLAKNHLLELIRPPMGERYQAWVNNLIDHAVMWRTSNPAFLLNCLRNHNIYAPIVNAIGTPLMVNAVEEYSKVPLYLAGSFPLTRDVEFFTAVSYIMNLYVSGERKCPMQQWCSESGLNVDDNCTVNPLARANIADYPDLCPVGALWRSWNLSRYQLNQQMIFRPICKK